MECSSDEYFLEEGEIPSNNCATNTAQEIPTQVKTPTITRWATVKNLVKISDIRRLLGSPTHGRVAVGSSPNKPFLDYISHRHREIRGKDARWDNKLDIPFVKLCYIEYFLHRSVDYCAVMHSRSRNSVCFRSKCISRRPRSLIDKQLDHALSELNLLKNKLHKTEAWATRAENICKSRMESVDYVAEDTRGKPLRGVVKQDMKNKECPVCSEVFTSEGWYRLGSCGHEYHIQCLLLHALCDRTCLLCEEDIPKEVYMSLGQDKNMPA